MQSVRLFRMENTPTKDSIITNDPRNLLGM